MSGGRDAASRTDPARADAVGARRVEANPVRAIADAVLYEGYILWPYRRSALKNKRRFTFGGVYPPSHSELHADDPCTIRAEVPIEGGVRTRVEVSVRFLQIVERSVARLTPNGLQAVDELVVGGERHLAWDEAVERELSARRLSLHALQAGRRLPIAIAGRAEREDLLAESGERVGALIRSWHELSGEVLLQAQPLAPGVQRIAVEVRNSTPFRPSSREQALSHAFCSTHMQLRATRGAFASLSDPPERLQGAAQECANRGVWPVLVGEPSDRDTVLCSPIILEDHPRIAPESPGDLFDGSEIDQLLILNILSLTDAEKEEMRASDPRAREILERTEALTPEQLMRLNGTFRDTGLARRP